MRWTVLIPAKALPAAKSRLAATSTDAGEHARLVGALRADTIAAARATAQVARVVLIVDREDAAPADAVVLVQIAPGLNAAVRQGAEQAARDWPDDGIAALVGDLPALRPDELAAALDAAARIPRGFVADHTGVGTTMLTAVPGQSLEPLFGADSAVRHARSATPLPAGPGLRWDVDTLDDLRGALEIGVGPATLAAAVASSTAGTAGVYPGGR
ncbi:MAG: 2-phospho-L-lactate/phosphoenolpyruvate guanylyltransferase [Pseudonocardiales bacterium]|jgi:2-phospho-L-lactate guanylyltransferase|nr:2-phospho-L-lactate/phosphoenolpyruvate guanylyltransferase [Pseudonocardiales bacterium]